MGFWNRLPKKSYKSPIESSSQIPINEGIDLALKLVFGFDQFRETQREAIQAFLQGQDTFVITKTGSGKSLCYWIPALLFEGLTIVFSPLKALIEDQKVFIYIIL